MKFTNDIERKDIEEILHSEYINWNFLKNLTILITGATGLIGSEIVNLFLYANEKLNANIKILALVRNKQKAEKMFSYNKTDNLKFIVQNIQQKLTYNETVDFIIHTANTTSSKEMVENPVETINSITIGTNNILDFAKSKNIKSLVYLSSMEVYGDIPLTWQDVIKETDYGYIDIAKPRSSYPEGKRIAENLCYGYFNEYNLPVKIARLAQTIGANVNYNDSRVYAEFARCIVENRDIILKTEGKSVRSYIYITDAIIAILKMLESGQNGEAYNIANPNATCSIKEMAKMLCDKYNNTNLRIELNDKYYPKDTNYALDISKFNSCSDWQPKIELWEMYRRLIENFDLIAKGKD